MTVRYALLVREVANRVYSARAPRLLAAELAAIAPALDGAVSAIEVVAFGGVPYVSFETPASLGDDDRFVLSNLSTTRALFEVGDDGSLRPVDVSPLARFDDDLVTIQKYPGKTNEQFTHLLVNLTVAVSRAAHERAAAGKPVRLLDPVAGRGSTLNRALVYGFDATGIELAEADVDQYRTFLTTYLKEHRIKHRLEREQVRNGPLKGTSRFAIRIRGEQQARMIRGDTALAADLLAGQQFDVVVGDLPYGVQHRATGEKVARSPDELLDAALPAWRSVMRGGAAIGLSWNLRTLSRAAVLDRLTAAGFELVEQSGAFEHAVDRSITRDLVVATR